MNFEDWAKIFSALSDANRLKILSYIFKNSEICVCDIIKYFNVTQPTISYHMKIIRESGLVTWREEGNACYYKINYEIVDKVNKYLKENLNFVSNIDSLSNSVGEH